METEIKLLCSSSHDMGGLATASVDLVVTSPPYPMIAMWDEAFGEQDERIRARLQAGEGNEAFELMHRLLDRTWDECDRVLKPGGIACINVGDATRTLDGDFRLYSNHWRVLKAFLDRGYAALPDILWRKQTNAPNKFMGSGMLPGGAYVTYEHEYILVLRKGIRRRFDSEEEKRLRRQSAYFWEERNTWFSDVWYDIKGTPQSLVTKEARDRSAAFPFELAYRLISMFSIRKDLVLDPFAGTGTTLAAALASGRSAVGMEMDSSLAGVGWDMLAAAPEFANRYTRERLARHMQFAAERTRLAEAVKAHEPALPLPGDDIPGDRASDRGRGWIYPCRYRYPEGGACRCAAGGHGGGVGQAHFVMALCSKMDILTVMQESTLERGQQEQ